MVEPIGGFLSDRPQGYHQALSDFGVLQLLSRIGNYSDRDFDAQRMCLKAPEIQSIATLLIEQLCVNVEGSVLASYLNIVRNREKLQRPWAIVQILPQTKTHQIARFANRQDAEDHARSLRRYVPNGVFEIVFEASESI
ncbi:hypothetical protein [Microseira sp. BLCC-F43]|jgi:hypothetical protein|uniref:hypothetical protein n=1 Tax=Microseira sp. BLCC-F43 TaxID=3153602 RepID=UPI0035BA8D44